MQGTKNGHPEDMCKGVWEEILRASPYERFTATVSYGKIELLDDNDSWETAYFFTPANYKPRGEFFDPSKWGTSHYNRITLTCYEPTSDDAVLNQILWVPLKLHWNSVLIKDFLVRLNLSYTHLYFTVDTNVFAFRFLMRLHTEFSLTTPYHICLFL